MSASQVKQHPIYWILAALQFLIGFCVLGLFVSDVVLGDGSASRRKRLKDDVE